MLNSHKLGVLGIVYVTFAAFMFFKNYDFIVNDIFNTPGRKLLHATKTYLLMLILIPSLISLSLYLSIYFTHPLLVNILPFLMVWIIFYALYQISANTNISFWAAMISSFIASLVWYLSKNAFVLYVTYNKTYASVYGSVSTLLFFFFWIYISWAVYLHGLKFCDLLNKDEEIDHI